MNIMDFIYFLGEHFASVVVGCIELLVGVFFLVHYFSINRGKKERRKQSGLHGMDKILFDEVKKRKGEAFIVLDKEERIPLYATGDIENLLGVSQQTLMKDVTSIFSMGKNKSQCSRIWEQYCNWDEKEKFTVEFQKTNDRWVRMSIYPTVEERYHIVYIWSTTEYHLMLEQYQEKARLAEEESQFKTSFLSRMSHEIRTPMNGIMGMITLAKGKVRADRDIMGYLDKAEELSEHMLSLINDILDMSRIEAGKVELENAPFSLKALRNKIYDMFAKNLEERKIRYEVNIEKLQVDEVVGDELRISQVIINFLSNAVKFTHQGEIIVTFKQMMLNSGVCDLLIRVHDTGIGMDTDFLKRIFRPFEQETIDTARNYGGTGLGMAISDSLVKLMGGEIVVESVKGQGSDFFVYLHLPVASDVVINEIEVKAEDEKNYDDAFLGRRILMAEDNEINAMIAQEVLGNMGAYVEVVGNGQEAIDAFAGHQPGYYDFILMDVQMPVMDGRTATERIRAMDRKDASEIMIFALSADAFVEDERKSIESGMNAHFSKPLDFKVLQREIGKRLGA